MFSQPSGISLYEGRTRGKKVRYTYSDNEHEDQDKESSHSSTTRSRHSPITAPNPDQPRFTASGRQIRRPQTGAYGESKINGSAGVNTGSNAPSENGYAYTQEAVVDEWKGDSQGDDDDEDDGGHNHGDDEEDADDESEWDDTAFLQQDAEKKSLRIVLKVNHERLSRKGSIHEGGGGEDVPMKDVETLANGHSPPIAKELNGA